MIDCGQNLYRDNVERIIMPFIENKNIHAIDTLILTHDDFDHNGGYDSLKRQNRNQTSHRRFKSIGSCRLSILFVVK